MPHKSKHQIHTHIHTYIHTHTHTQISLASKIFNSIIAIFGLFCAILGTFSAIQHMDDPSVRLNAFMYKYTN